MESLFVMCSEEDKLILGWFMKERVYECHACGATLITAFDEPDEIDCPDCGCVMGAPSEREQQGQERIYICENCGFGVNIF